MTQKSFTRAIVLALSFCFIFTSISFAGAPGTEPVSLLPENLGSVDSVDVTQAQTKASKLLFQGDTYDVRSFTLPEKKDRFGALMEVLELYGKDVASLTEIVNYASLIMQHTPNVDEDDVFADMRKPLKDLLKTIDATEKATPGSRLAIKAAVDAAVSELRKINQADVDKLLTEIKELKAGQMTNTQRIGTLIDGQARLKNQMSNFWDQQSFLLYVSKDTSTKFGVKVHMLKKVAGVWTLSDKLPKLLVNYNTVERTDTKALNIFGLARTNIRTSDQTGFARVIVSSRGIARNNVYHLFPSVPAEIDGITGHPVLVSVESDPFMTEATLHKDLNFRGLHNVADRNWLIKQ